MREFEDVELADLPPVDSGDEVLDLEPAADLPPVVAEPADPVLRLEPKVDAMALLVQNTKAKDDASYLVVCEQTKGINALIAEVDATFDPLVLSARQAVDEAKAALEARKTALEQVRQTKAKHRGPLEAALQTNKGEIARYADAKERAAREAIEAEERRQRAEAEAQRAKEVEERRAAGKAEEAAALAAKPIETPPAMVASKASAGAPKASGVSLAKVAKATVTDLAALIIGVADKLQKPELAGPPLDVLTFGKSKLNAWAAARLKGPLSGFGGIAITGASADVTDFVALVLGLASTLRALDKKDATGLIDVIEVAPAVLNKWTTAQGTALNWPGVSVEMVTEVSASRRG